MNKFEFDKVDILLIDPDRASRATLRNILVDNGFRNVTQEAGMADIDHQFNIAMPDLLISDMYEKADIPIAAEATAASFGKPGTGYWQSFMKKVIRNKQLQFTIGEEDGRII